MTPNEPGSRRRDAIMAILTARHTVRVAELRERLDVSEVTIRKDLAFLEDAGLLRRIHGGAELAEQRRPDRQLPARRRSNTDVKRLIARRAAALVTHGETIYIDSGSTCALLAEAVRDLEIRVVTNSLDVLNALADRSSASLFVIGGSYRQNAGSFIGPWAAANLASVQLDHAFLGTTGVSDTGAFSSQNSIESEVKATAIRRAATAVVLADRSKIGVQAFSIFAEPADIDLLITDADLTVRRRFETLGIHVLGVEYEAEI